MQAASPGQGREPSPGAGPAPGPGGGRSGSDRCRFWSASPSRKPWQRGSWAEAKESKAPDSFPSFSARPLCPDNGPWRWWKMGWVTGRQCVQPRPGCSVGQRLSTRGEGLCSCLMPPSSSEPCAQGLLAGRLLGVCSILPGLPESLDLGTSSCPSLTGRARQTT